MIKLIHVIIILTSFVSFISRFALLKFKPNILQNKFLKIAPHVIDTFLLISGVILIFQGRWLEGEFGWIISKLVLLFGYIALALISMRSKGVNQWLAFFGAILCYVFIFGIAISKNGFI